MNDRSDPTDSWEQGQPETACCPVCGFDNHWAATECASCHEPLTPDCQVAELPPLVTCWRCQKANPADALQCRFCEATLRTEDHEKKRQQVSGQKHGLVTMVGLYALALFLLLINGWWLQFGVHRRGKDDAALFREALPILVVTDILFLGLALFSFWLLRREARQPPGKSALLAWSLAFPLLAVVLVINLSYHWCLKQAFHIEDIQFPFWGSDLWLWTILIMCVQPAVAEELFFRQVVFGTLRRNMSFHGAVWVSSLIFALAHLGGILSIPTLMLAGALFAYMRAATGLLLLPMLLHFTHNLLVVMI